jgi:hypothetical protein
MRPLTDDEILEKLLALNAERNCTDDFFGIGTDISKSQLLTKNIIVLSAIYRQ